MDIVEESNFTIKKTCEILQLNPDRYYRWRSWFNANGIKGLENNKSKPGSCPHSLLETEKQKIIEYALDNPDTRHRKLAYEMQNKDIVYVSPSSVYRVLKENDLIPSQEYHQEESADGKIEVQEPNQMWHIDITYIPVANDHAYLISVLDGYSRCIVHSKLSLTMTTEDIKEVMSRALFKADLFEVSEDERPKLISDNGTQLVSNSFQKFLSDLDIEHIRTAVRHPESNGKIEVFHKTLKHENVYIKEKYQSFYEARDDIEEFIETYNHTRLHQGIEFVTPHQKYTGKAEEIIETRKESHQNAIERRKRLNRAEKSKAA